MDRHKVMPNCESDEKRYSGLTPDIHGGEWLKPVNI